MNGQNDVEIKVRSNTRAVNFKEVEKQSGSLRDSVVADANAMRSASEKLAAARGKEADAAGKVRVAEVKLNELRESGKAKAGQLADAEERLASAQRKSTDAAAKAADAEKRLNDERAKAADDTPVASGGIDFSQGLRGLKSGIVGELKSAGMIGGVALGSGVAAGLSSVGAAGMFVGIAAAAQSSNENVRAAYSTMWDQVKSEARASSDVLADDFIQTAETLGRTFNALQPQMREAFAASQPVVRDLTDGVDRLARQAMPGFVTGAKAAAQVSDNVADAMESAGRGVSNFFTEASEGAATGGEAITSFGKIIERMGSFAGRILATLANGSSTVFPALESTVDSAATAVENLADNAFPAMASGAALGLSGLTLLLNLANVLIGVLGPLAPQILSVASALKLIDMVSFGGVRSSWDSFKGSLSEAPTMAGKAKAGVSALVTSGLVPLVAIAGIAAIGLDALASSQQRTAERQRAITAAFRESKGAIDENVRATVAKSLADEGLLSKGKEIGLSAGVMTDAWLNNKSAMDEVRAASSRYTKELEGQGQMEGQVAQGADELSTKAHEVVSAMDDQSSETANAAREGKLYAEAMETGAKGAEGLAKANKDAAKALQELHDQITGLINKDIGYRNAIEATKNAQKEAAAALKEHGNKSVEFAETSRGVESALAAQAQAAYDLAYANSVSTTDLGKVQDATMAYNQEVLRLAISSGKDMPRALGLMVSKLSETDLKALGATRTINGLHQEVIRLPDGKEIVVQAEDRATSVITNIAGRSYTAVVKMVGQWAGFYGLPNGVVLSGSSARGNAHGGIVGSYAHGGIPHAAEGGARGPIVRVNERGQESARLPDGNLVMLPTGSSINTAEDTARLASQQGGGAMDVRLSWATGTESDLMRAIVKGLRVEVQRVGGDPNKLFRARP